MNKINKQEEDTVKKNTINIIIALGIATFFMLVFEMWVVNSLSTYGDRLAELNKTKSELQLENEMLEAKIAQKSSLQSIQVQAEKLGFQNMSNIAYISSNNIASAQQ